MIFDLFHSISDPVVLGQRMGSRRSFEQFFSQMCLAEALGCDTVWLAESHFSSEVQKKNRWATIPEFFGEVGLNSDSFQWMHEIYRRTKRIGLGTAIHNIVGGSGGPIASADRVRTLDFINQHVWESPRQLRIGVASGRFPYQNSPFGVWPRNEMENVLWPLLKKYIFLESLEIFLRLLNGEALSSAQISRYEVTKNDRQQARLDVAGLEGTIAVEPRWVFEPLELVPQGSPSRWLHVVLGSSDPDALELGLKYFDLDLFNLSFTAPAEIEKLHEKMAQKALSAGRHWNRARLPRTVLVFVDPSSKKAHDLAHHVLDTYIEAMRGTAQVPPKEVLLSRALVGDAVEVREQLHPENTRKLHSDDRLMLWFEFNQLDGEAIEKQMKYFFNEVVGKL